MSEYQGDPSGPQGAGAQSSSYAALPSGVDAKPAARSGSGARPAPTLTTRLGNGQGSSYSTVALADDSGGGATALPPVAMYGGAGTTLGKDEWGEPRKTPRASRFRHPCPSCCAVFSLSGVVFLLFISTYFSDDSVFMIIDGKYEDDKPALTKQIYIAALMYFACFVGSVGVQWKRQKFGG